MDTLRMDAAGSAGPILGVGPGEGKATVGIGGTGLVEEIIPEQSATAPLSLVLDACTLGYLLFTGNSVRGLSVMVVPQQKVLAPSVMALTYVLNLDQDVNSESKQYAIWKSVLMCSSYRPVNMVFSIIGLFKVKLDTGTFNKDDCLGATITVAMEILKKGGSTTWLGTLFQMEPNRWLSTFSTFPPTSESGKALLVDSKYPNRDALLMPSGSMDANGYFHLSRKAIHVVPAMEVQQHRLKEPKKPYDHAPKLTLVRAVDKSIWEVADDSEGREDELGQCSVTQAYMVLLGWFNEYSPGGTSAHDADNIWMMLVEEHAAKLQSKQWEYPFAVGGPQGRQHQDADDIWSKTKGEEQCEMVVEEDRFPFPTASRPNEELLRDEGMRKLRWAVDQCVLEQHYAPLQD
ncbi:hypothetical protein L208DRAFT_1383171 [Tricholoma matsutake]|nr:hypothetical protein L208DRAFT_1383171 [Tricholoma matsutake 945]